MVARRGLRFTNKASPFTPETLVETYGKASFMVLVRTRKPHKDVETRLLYTMVSRKEAGNQEMVMLNFIKVLSKSHRTAYPTVFLDNRLGYLEHVHLTTHTMSICFVHGRRHCWKHLVLPQGWSLDNKNPLGTTQITTHSAQHKHTATLSS